MHNWEKQWSGDQRLGPQPTGAVADIAGHGRQASGRTRRIARRPTKPGWPASAGCRGSIARSRPDGRYPGMSRAPTPASPPCAPAWSTCLPSRRRAWDCAYGRSASQGRRPASVWPTWPTTFNASSSMNREQPRPESAHTPESQPTAAAPTDPNPHASPEPAPFRRIRDAISPQSVHSAVLGGSQLGCISP